MQQKKLAAVMAVLCVASAFIIGVCVKNLKDEQKDEDSGGSVQVAVSVPVVEVSQGGESGAEDSQGEDPEFQEGGEDVQSVDNGDNAGGKDTGDSKKEEPVTTTMKPSPDDEYTPSFVDSAAEESGICGAWQYEDGTIYEFNLDLTGGLYYLDYKFLYSYTLDGDQLAIDYERSEVTDAVYTYELLDKNTIKLIGGTGTDGGTYTMTRYK